VRHEPERDVVHEFAELRKGALPALATLAMLQRDTIAKALAAVAAARATVPRPASTGSDAITSYQVPIHDIDLAVSEVTRVADLGAKSLQLPVFPNELGELDYFHDRYDPSDQAVERVSRSTITAVARLCG
jgi:hypothetical protein